MTEPELQLIEGKYEILRKLREGGMGAVYKVRHRLLDEIRVIKVIRPHLSGEEALRRRFLREARAAVRLRHPNIAQLYDFTVDDSGTAYMVMEFIDGEDLGRLLKRHGRLASRTALEVGVQALRALYYLHRSQVVHRDISPDNLMISQDMDGKLVVKLIDLGIAKPLKSNLELTQQDLFLGKVRYTSPEQLGGAKRRAEVGPRSDLYALGVVLYEIASGVHPIEGDNHEAIIAGHLFHPPRDFAESDPEERVPPAMRAALRRSLEKLPDARFADAVEFSAALEAAMGDCEEPDATIAALLDGAEGDAAGPEEPTSIQEHLDREFAPEPTRPSALLEPVDPGDVLIERVESLLQAGRLGRAEEELERAQRAAPIGPRLVALAERVARAHVEADHQLATARGQRDHGKLEEALRTLDRAAERYADVSGLTELRSAIEQAIERQRSIELARLRIEGHLAAGEGPEAARALARAVEKLDARAELAVLQGRLPRAAQALADGDIAGLVTGIEELLAAGRLPEATTAIAAARRAHGRDFARLGDRLEESLERRRIELATEHARRLAELGAEAQALAARRDFAGALARLQEALALRPDSAEVLDLERQVRLAQFEDERRLKARDAAAGRIAALLEFDELASAGAQLDAAERVYGAHQAFAVLRERLRQQEGARAAAEAAHQARIAEARVATEVDPVASLVAAAQRQAAAGDVAGAVARLRQAHRMAPQDGAIASLLRAGERHLEHGGKG